MGGVRGAMTGAAALREPERIGGGAMLQILRFCCASILLLSLCGCFTNADLQRQTVNFLAGKVSSDQLALSDIRHGITATTWKATAPAGQYDCSTDYMLFVVYCSRR